LQKFSLQASGATLFSTTEDPNYQSETRLGFEGQFRYTMGRFSVGAGYQRSTVFSFTDSPLTVALSLVFVEPRYVVTAGQAIAVYVAGRLGVGKLICSEPTDCAEPTTNLSYGGGGGLLFRLNRRLSVDLGAQYFAVNGDFSSSYALIRAGLGVGL
jgi:opacity protein-like surface antigen